MANSLASNAVDFSEADDDNRIGYAPTLNAQAGLKSQLEKKAAKKRFQLGQMTPADYLLFASQMPGRLANNLVNAAVSGFTAPHDVLTGDLQVQDPLTGHSSEEAMRRSMDLAGLASSATIGASAEEGAVTLGAGAMKRPKIRATEDVLKPTIVGKWNENDGASAVRFKGKVYAGEHHAEALSELIKDYGYNPDTAEGLDAASQNIPGINNLDEQNFGRIVDGEFVSDPNEVKDINVLRAPSPRTRLKEDKPTSLYYIAGQRYNKGPNELSLEELRIVKEEQANNIKENQANYSMELTNNSKDTKPTAEQVVERNQSLSDKFHEDTLGDMAYEYLEGKGLLPTVNTEGWRAEFRPASKMWKVFDADNNEVSMVNVLGAPTAEDAIKYVGGKSPAESWPTSKLLDFAKKNGWKGPSETGGSVELNAGKSKEAGGFALASDHPQWGQAAFKFRGKLYTDDFHAGAIDKFLSANGYKKAAEGGLDDAVRDMPDLQNVADESLGGIGKDGKFVPFTSDEISKTPRRSGGFFANKSKEAGGLFLAAGKEPRIGRDLVNFPAKRVYGEKPTGKVLAQATDKEGYKSVITEGAPTERPSDRWDGKRAGTAWIVNPEGKAVFHRYWIGQPEDSDLASTGLSWNEFKNLPLEKQAEYEVSHQVSDYAPLSKQYTQAIETPEERFKRLGGKSKKDREIFFANSPKREWQDLNANKSKEAGGLALASDPAPVFYSAVEKAIDASSTKSASGDQWLGTLRNAPGVKGEEIEWTGLEKALKDRPGANQPKQWTKEEVKQALQANKVNVEEHWKGKKPDQWSLEDPAVQSEVDQQLDGWYEDFQDEHGRVPTHDEAHNQRQSILQDIMENPEGFDLQEPVNGTKFSEYQLPGGENYRELVMTLPRNAKDEYYSSHWDETNVLAHVRMNDRELPGADGTSQRTLFLEELQSDWHQSGRKQGYKGRAELRSTDLEQVGEPIYRDGTSGPGTYTFKTPDGQEITGSGWGFDQARNSAMLSYNHAGVPDAPFKRSWPSLLLNRMVREAAEKGYDQIAWTDGATQAERYNLSKHIDALDFVRKPGNKTEIALWKDGRQIQRQDYADNTLSDVVGKEIAEKIQKSEKDRGSLRGLDLKVGGEGMRGFYDDMLPKIANKNFGKLGGKVKTGKIGGETDRYYAEPDVVSGKYRLMDRGMEGGKPKWITSLPKDEALAEAERWNKDHNPNYTIHVLPITPQMREHALSKGFPLFSSGVPVPDGSSVEGYQRDKVVPGVKLVPVDHVPEFEE